jgi:predicted transcriptional regulator
MRPSSPRPTDAELAILRILWARGPSTVRDVHLELSATQQTGYTTILKLLQIMTDKGLVLRDETERAHIYQAAMSEERTQQGLVKDLLEKAFGGSAQKLVLRALSTRKTSPEELAAIRKLLDELEGEQR